MKTNWCQWVAVFGLVVCSAKIYADQSLVAANEGELAIYQGDYKLAESYYLKQFRESENKNKALADLGRIYLFKGETTKAVEYIEQALKIEPNNAEELILAGDIYGMHAHNSTMFTALKMGKKCREHYEAAVVADPQSVDALISAIQFYFDAPSFIGGSTKKGSELLTQLQALSPEDAKTIQARQLEKEGKTEEAVALADQLAEAGFISAKNQYEIARFYRNKKMLDKALPLFASLAGKQESIKTWWYIQDSLLQQGELHMMKNEFTKAIELINQYKQKNKNTGDVHYFWATWSLAKAHKAAGNQTEFDQLVAQIKSENYKQNKFFAMEFEKALGL